MRCQTRVSPRCEVGTWQTSDTACGGDVRGREHRRAELDEAREAGAAPEMNQTKQGSQWCFGMSVHILVDAGVGPGAHSDVAEAGYSMESEGIEYRYRGGLGRVPTGSAERAKVDLAKFG